VLSFAPTLRLGGGLGSSAVEGLAGQALSEHLLAVLREALSNAARHSGASQVWVTVDLQGGWLTALVRDDGHGIPAGVARSGLRNMADRAEQLGGQLRVSPAEGGGTELEWRVPGPADEPDGVAQAPRYPLR
jgi:signal transduction histidine kinase